MKFLYIPEEKKYYEINFEEMKLYNYNQGWRNISENASYWINGEIVEYADWAELIKSTHYIFKQNDYHVRSGWLAPNGVIYECRAHSLISKDLAYAFYPDEISESTYEDDLLISKGWHKLTTSLLWDYYTEEQILATLEQKEVIEQWCEYHNMPMPSISIVRY